MSDLQEIYVLNKRLKLLHTEKGFKTSMDSVLLAAACPAKAGDHILDMGCGVGGAGFCVLVRVDGVQFTGVEVQKDHVALAERNAVVNKLEKRAVFIVSDIRDYREEHAYHHVICNPPYLEAGAHLRSPHKEKATAMGGASLSCAKARGRDDGALSVKDWVDAAYDCVKSNGTLTMIHRADKVDKIIQALGKRFGAVEIIPLWPRRGENAKRVILRAIKHRKSPAIIHAGLVLHDENKGYTYEATQILRNGEAL